MDNDNKETWTPPDKGCMPAHIRKWAPPQCPVKAVIPLVEVATPENLKTLSNCFAYVQSTNTTYYIDNQHRFIVCWRGPVEASNYDLDANALGLRSQFIIDDGKNQVAYYNKTGRYQILGGEGDKSTRLTVSYDIAGDWREFVMQGPDIDYKETLARGHSVGSFTVPNPVFHNETTGANMTTEEVYNALKSGEHFIFDGLPVGLFYDINRPLGQNAQISGTWDNLTMDAYAFYRISGTENTADGFSGVLSTRNGFGYNAVFSLVLGYGINHIVINNEDFYELNVDGIVYSNQPQPN